LKVRWRGTLLVGAGAPGVEYHHGASATSDSRQGVLVECWAISIIWGRTNGRLVMRNCSGLIWRAKVDFSGQRLVIETNVSLYQNRFIVELRTRHCPPCLALHQGDLDPH